MLWSQKCNLSFFEYLFNEPFLNYFHKTKYEGVMEPEINLFSWDLFLHNLHNYYNYIRFEKKEEGKAINRYNGQK